VPVCFRATVPGGDAHQSRQFRMGPAGRPQPRPDWNVTERPTRAEAGRARITTGKAGGLTVQAERDDGYYPGASRSPMNSSPPYRYILTNGWGVKLHRVDGTDHVGSARGLTAAESRRSALECQRGV